MYHTSGMYQQPGQVLMIDELYVQQRISTSNFITMAAVVGVAILGLMAEFVGPSAGPTATLRSVFGDAGTVVFVLITAAILDLLIFLFGHLYFGRNLRTNHVARVGQSIDLSFEASSISLLMEDTIVLERIASGRTWKVRNGQSYAFSIEVPVAAFPKLDLFLRANVPGLIEQ